MGFGSIPNKLQQCAAWCIIHCLLSLPCSKRTSASKVCAACSSSTPLHPLGSRQHQQQQPGVVPCVWLRMVSEGKRKTLSKAVASSNSCQRSSPSSLCADRGSQSHSQEVVPVLWVHSFPAKQGRFCRNPEFMSEMLLLRCCSLGRGHQGATSPQPIISPEPVEASRSCQQSHHLLAHRQFLLSQGHSPWLCISKPSGLSPCFFPTATPAHRTLILSVPISRQCTSCARPLVLQIPADIANTAPVPPLPALFALCPWGSQGGGNNCSKSHSLRLLFKNLL